MPNSKMVKNSNFYQSNINLNSSCNKSRMSLRFSNATGSIEQKAGKAREARCVLHLGKALS